MVIALLCIVIGIYIIEYAVNYWFEYYDDRKDNADDEY